MKRNSLTGLYEGIEEPLMRVLAKMERDGVKVDLRQLDEFAAHLRGELAEREERIRGIAEDQSLNISVRQAEAGSEGQADSEGKLSH